MATSKTKTIKQSVIFKSVKPLDVYEAIMDSKKHAKFTGQKVTMSTKVGGKFVCFGGYCWGKNLELVPGKKIVQSWTTSDWEKGQYSTVTYEFKKEGTGTKLSFTQKDVPIEHCDSIAQGWKDYYWTPMKEMFAPVKTKAKSKAKK